MKNLITNTTLFIVGALIIFFLFKATFDALDKQDEIDCNKWAHEAKEYNNYYITQNQKDQCDTFGITINTQVK